MQNGCRMGCRMYVQFWPWSLVYANFYKSAWKLMYLRAKCTETCKRNPCCLPTTVTSKLHTASFPVPSVKVYVTVTVPTVNRSPVFAVATTDGTAPELSVAVGTVHSTTAELESSGRVTTRSDGQSAITGTVMSGPTGKGKKFDDIFMAWTSTHCWCILKIHVEIYDLGLYHMELSSVDMALYYKE